MSLSSAVKIYCDTERVIPKGHDGITWSFPLNEVRLGTDWYLEKYEILSRAPAGSVLVDAGCKEASWIGGVHGIVPPGVLRIGIDPVDYNVMSQRGGPTPFSQGDDMVLHHYYCCAIDDVDKETTATFHIFDEPGCNSLLPKSEHLVCRNVLKTVTVPVTRLETILLKHVSPGTEIYYLKCDCQGKDVSVVKSLRSFLPHTKYVQIESSFSRERPFYTGQPSHEDDVAEMEKLGFEPIYYVEYSGSPLPEGEILFKRMR